MRKLIRIGFETYVGNLYKEGKITLREAARLMNINQIEAVNIFLDAGIKGNLDASDVLNSFNRFVKQIRISRRGITPAPFIRGK